MYLSIILLGNFGKSTFLRINWRDKMEVGTYQLLPTIKVIFNENIYFWHLENYATILK